MYLPQLVAVTFTSNVHEDADYWIDPVWQNRIPCYSDKQGIEFYTANQSNAAMFDQPEVSR